MNQITPVQATQGFNSHAKDGNQTFTYQQARYTPGIVFFGIIVFGIVSLIPTMLLSSNAAWLVCTFVLPVALYFVANARRKDGSFTISAKSIQVGGVDYDRSRISALFIKAPYSHEQTLDYKNILS